MKCQQIEAKKIGLNLMVVERGGTQAVSSSRDTRTPEGRNAINYVVFTDFTVSENGMEEHRERFLFSEPHQAH